MDAPKNIAFVLNFFGVFPLIQKVDITPNINAKIKKGEE